MVRMGSAQLAQQLRAIAVRQVDVDQPQVMGARFGAGQCTCK